MTVPPVQVRRVNDASALGPGVQFRVQRTLLPLHWLRGVPVLRDISHDLTVFERFILEMALTLGAVSGQDVKEVLDLQPEFLVRGAWRLAVAGALRLEGDLYRVVPDVAEALRSAKSLPQRVQSTADFVLLPRTGDLLAVAPGQGGWLAEADRQRRKLRPHGAAPAPENLWSARRAEYLAERVQANSIAGSDHEIAEVIVPADGDEALLPRLQQRGRKRQSQPDDGDDNPPRGCPAYNCSAEVRDGPHGPEVEVHLIAEPASSSQADSDGNGDTDKDNTDQDGADHGGDAEQDDQRSARQSQFTLRADFTGAANLVATWRAQLNALDSEPNLRAAWEEVAGTSGDFERADRTGPSTWVFHVGGEAAEAIAASKRSLIEPAGLAIESEETIVEAHVELRAADEVADMLFARDLLVAALLAAPDPRAALTAAPDEEAALRERIWQLGHFRLAYALREAEDFRYE